MARLNLIEDKRFLLHDPGSGHPERPERLPAVRRGCMAAFADVQSVQPVEATESDLLRVHTAGHVERVLAARGQRVVFDADTATSPGSVEAALLAAGGAIVATRAVIEAPDALWFCNIRPPGHHAEANRAMGFCLFNNVAVAAAWALAQDPTLRVAIIDPDVHHGNGTQAIFWNEPRVLYISLHQAPFYPGTGSAAETGGPAAPGSVINFPLPAGAGDAEYLAIVRDAVRPALSAFRPGLLLISAGFDAHRLDPLGGLRVTTEGFGAFFAEIGAWARAAGVPVATMLEGGYSLEALESAVPASLQGLAGACPAVGPVEPPVPAVAARIAEVRRQLGL